MVVRRSYWRSSVVGVVVGSTHRPLPPPRLPCVRGAGRSEEVVTARPVAAWLLVVATVVAILGGDALILVDERAAEVVASRSEAVLYPRSDLRSLLPPASSQAAAMMIPRRTQRRSSAGTHHSSKQQSRTASSYRHQTLPATQASFFDTVAATTHIFLLSKGLSNQKRTGRTPRIVHPAPP